ncbi:MAG: hypothetical protein ACLS28_00405 [Clostridium neonatale]
MTKTEILFHLQEFNKDELFYQKYYNAQSQKWMFDKFLKEQNTSELIKRQLIVPELSTSFNPTSYLSKDFFLKMIIQIVLYLANITDLHLHLLIIMIFMK